MVGLCGLSSGEASTWDIPEAPLRTSGIQGLGRSIDGACLRGCWYRLFPTHFLIWCERILHETGLHTGHIFYIPLILLLPSLTKSGMHSEGPRNGGHCNVMLTNADPPPGRVCHFRPLGYLWIVGGYRVKGSSRIVAEAPETYALWCLSLPVVMSN